MLWHRAKNKSGSFLRWMMTDSSTQHGRSFQLTSILSLNVQSALRALSDANDLVMLWHLDLFGSLFVFRSISLHHEHRTIKPFCDACTSSSLEFT